MQREQTGAVDGRLGAESRKVLLVDDDAPLRKNLARAFERDGFEVATRLKADPATASIPIIMLSAMAGRGARVIGLESGAEEYLAKPFDRVELLEFLRAFVGFRVD